MRCTHRYKVYGLKSSNFALRSVLLSLLLCTFEVSSPCFVGICGVDKMALPISRLTQLKASSTYQILPYHHRQVWLDHLLEPKVPYEKPEDDEVFRSPEHCLERLKAWGFYEGCSYIKGRTRPKNTTPNWSFHCIFHDEHTLNRRKLEDCVVREEGEITTERKRDTYNLRRGCEVLYYLALKRVAKRGSENDERQYIGIWRSTEHTGRQLPINPLSFHGQRSTTEDYQKDEFSSYQIQHCEAATL